MFTNVIGYGSTGLGDSIHIGYGAQAEQTDSFAIGQLAFSKEQGGVALGAGALIDVGGVNSYALGNNASVYASNGYAFGYLATVNTNDGFAFGSNAVVDHAFSYVFGANGASTRTNQYRFGDSGSEISIPGQLTAAGITNLNVTNAFNLGNANGKLIPATRADATNLIGAAYIERTNGIGNANTLTNQTYFEFALLSVAYAAGPGVTNAVFDTRNGNHFKFLVTNANIAVTLSNLVGAVTTNRGYTAIIDFQNTVNVSGAITLGPTNVWFSGGAGGTNWLSLMNTNSGGLTTWTIKNSTRTNGQYDVVVTAF